MAGSYGHITNSKGQFVGVELLENGGDTYEACEELYGMIWFLAGGDKKKVKEAHEAYQLGLRLSPGKGDFDKEEY